MKHTALETRHVQIREGVRQRILRRDYGPGDRLPTESQLMAEFRVSRGTVARAMRDLELGGLLVRRKGAGTFVQKAADAVTPRPATRLSRITVMDRCPADNEWFGYATGMAYQALGELCTEQRVDLSLQRIAITDAGRIRAAMLSAADAVIARGAQVVLYSPVELPSEYVSLNSEVVRRLQAGGIAIVLNGRDVVPYPDRSTLPQVQFENRRAGVILVHHMAKAGYRRVAFVGIPAVSTAVTERRQGYYEGVGLYGLPADDRLVIETEDPTDADVDHLLSVARADAVICKCTHTAARVGQLLTRRGVRIGPDVGLAGCDASPIADLLPVPLTTVTHPMRTWAQALFSQAVAAVADPAATMGLHTTVHCELRPRGSTCRS